MMSAPHPEQLGKLSAKYESGPKGSAAIGKDSQGGASYGKYQIATKTGTMDLFLTFCMDRFPEVTRVLLPVKKSMFDKNGEFARAWVKLAEQGIIQKPEHDFIQETHYDPAFNKLKIQIQTMVVAYRALQEVLWSASVQHGSVVNIFTEAYVAPATVIPATPQSVIWYIKNIYARRSNRLSKLTPKERASVLDRYRHECDEAVALVTG